ncbi:hypothetical protein BDV96DRAFT_23797 [Lophiotrema nucula]|uniref:Uncharacterized protein n=1 Tax=Lophiotrema nucula TaxID=690887 RepID=A0A6A5ZE13_9PLEO|nr:hypothetical protein BDV96DRAFT_23797 [Lophiotrema nucula]
MSRPYYTSSSPGFYYEDENVLNSGPPRQTSTTNPLLSTIDRGISGRHHTKFNKVYNEYAESLKPTVFRTKPANPGGLRSKLTAMGILKSPKRSAEADAAKARVEEAERARKNTKRVLSKQKTQGNNRKKELHDRISQASPATLRDLRELIRKRYKLDIDIWSLRGVRVPDRPVVKEKMEQSDAILDEILAMVETWGDNGETFEDEERKKMQMVKARLKGPGKRNWATHPPWAGN